MSLFADELQRENRGQQADPSVRVYAAKAIYESETTSATVIPHLVGRLEDTNHDVRYYAVAALGHVGPAARRAIGALQRTASRGDDRLKQTVDVAIQSIRSPNRLASGRASN